MDEFKWSVVYSNTAALAVRSDATCSIVVKESSVADWLQWRFDECRTAQSPIVLPDQLVLQWRRDLPVCSGIYDSLYDNDIDQCRPVQLGKMLFVCQVANDCVTAYDTDTGASRWRYYTSGALRRPPVALRLRAGQADRDVVIFGCDDGYVYCLNAADGSERWKFQAAPNSKKAMGFGRLSSIWPVWASPVAYKDRIYFAAGYLPSWGVFPYCLDAASGAVIWCNDGRLLAGGNLSSGFGPLLFSAKHNLIYGSVQGKGSAWALDPVTGELAGYSGRRAEHWALQQLWYIGENGANAFAEPPAITAGGRTFTRQSLTALGFSPAQTIGCLLAGDGKLFVSTKDGGLYCFGGAKVATPKIYENIVTPLPAANDIWTEKVKNMLSRDDLKQGLALVWGVGSGRLVEELAKQAPGLMIVAVDPDFKKLQALRTKMDGAGWSGARVSTLQGNPLECGFAPYQAALITSEDLDVAGFTNGTSMVRMLYKCARPFGGEIWLPATAAQHTAIEGWLSAAKLPTCNNGPSYQVSSQNGFTRIQRSGFPDGQQIVKPPFRPIAFGVSGSALPGETAENMYENLSIDRADMHEGEGIPVIVPAQGNSFLKTLDPHPPYMLAASNPQRGVKQGFDLYSWLPVTAAEIGYEPPAPIHNNTVRCLGT